MTASRKGVDSTDTPPLSDIERAEKKAAKKARKEARRAEAAAAEGGDAEMKTAEADAEPVVKRSKKDKKRKVEESVDAEAQASPVKVKKSKKSSAAVAEEPSTPLASTSAPISSSDITAFLTDNRVSYEPPETATSTFPPVLSFAALPLDAGVRKGLAGYTKPTPIQSASFPVMMGGRDVIGIAETG